VASVGIIINKGEKKMANKNIDPKSRDYSFKDIEDDERFVRTTKEFWITLGVYAVFTALMILNLYTLGAQDPSTYVYVLGFPLWIFVEICLLIGMVAAVLFVVTFVYRDMDITPKGNLLPKGNKNEEIEVKGELSNGNI
jgi:uncharacterized membrane protein YhdT